jgi:hypothetical protein
MQDTQFYNDGVGVSLRCTLCGAHIGAIEADSDEADSLQILVDMYNNHTCEEAA